MGIFHDQLDCGWSLVTYFLHYKPRDWLGRTSLKWDNLYRVGCKASTYQSLLHCRSYTCWDVLWNCSGRRLCYQRRWCWLSRAVVRRLGGSGPPSPWQRRQRLRCRRVWVGQRLGIVVTETSETKGGELRFNIKYACDVQTDTCLTALFTG